MNLPISALIYIFNGTVAFWYGLRSLRAYLASGIWQSKFIFYVGLGVAFAEWLYGFPNFFAPEATYLNGLLYVMAIIPLFWGASFALKISLKEWGYIKSEKITAILIPILALIFAWLHLSSLPAPFTDNAGFIHWRIEPLYGLVWSTALFLVVVLPGIFFASHRAESKKAFIKKIMFGATFIMGGIGGIGVVLFRDGGFLLPAYFIAQFIGFAILASIALVDVFMKD